MPPLMSVEEYVALPVAEPDHVIPYGDDAEQFGHLYLPDGDEPHPVIIVVHGGCWRSQYDIYPASGYAQALTEVGAAVWSLEYRRGDKGGEWPHTFADIADGSDHLRTIADRHNLDVSRVMAVGHSAGGLLALWLAGRHKLPQSSPLYSDNPLPIRSVVALGTLTNFVTAYSAGICEGALETLLGGTPETAPDNYHHTSPINLLPLGIPQILITGEADDMLLQAHEYISVAQEIDDVERIIVPDVGHFELVTPTTQAWPIAREAVSKVLP